MIEILHFAEVFGPVQVGLGWEESSIVDIRHHVDVQLILFNVPDQVSEIKWVGAAIGNRCETASNIILLDRTVVSLEEFVWNALEYSQSGSYEHCFFENSIRNLCAWLSLGNTVGGIDEALVDSEQS